MNIRWFLLTLTGFAGLAGAQTRQSLFDGKTLTGWHTQGPGTWTVTDGRIHALNPTKQWGHLFTDQAYQNGYVRFKFLNVVGNSGLYVRASQGGVYGAKGIQVDIGTPHNDGSVMRVTDSAYAWFAEVTKAVDSGYLKLKAGKWNELAVDVQGSSLKTYINGKLIWSQADVSGMAANGLLALQLHSGSANDISFKDIEILSPTRIPHCPDPGDPAYRPGNDPDSSLCRKTTALRPRSARTGLRGPAAFLSIDPITGPLPAGWRFAPRADGVAFDLSGVRRVLPLPAGP